MQGLVYRLSLPRVAVARLLGGRVPWLLYGPLGPVRLETLPDPQLPGDDWAVVRPVLAGVCGTDLGVISARTSPAASPFSSFPAVLGHEVVGRIERAGPGVSLPPGTRVVVDPSLSCEIRGYEPACDRCAEGWPYLCANAAEGRFGPALITGYCAALPGGWGERMLAHRSQLFTVPDEVADERAVLVEPLAIGLHAVLRRRPGDGDRVLVIGAGTIGLCLLAALRMLGLRAHVTVAAKHGVQADLARALGADHVVPPSRLADDARQRLGARGYKPILGRTVYRGGYDVVYDCVGSRRSLDDALRLAREGGAVVVVGGAGEIPWLDWTFVWMRELDVIGAAGYGLEHVNGRVKHTFALVLEGLAAHPDLPVERMVTHRFALAQYRQALAAALDRRRSGAVKIVFAPQAGSSGDAGAAAGGSPPGTGGA
ncbi:MAG: zinc-binding dehydrogenase [Thermaerobacter sp.]|nr:alcohol dehydrogenase [Bacillota bacterium]REJ37078.1 MAG: alcohol dehydrogenase [Bacillota bacterium]